MDEKEKQLKQDQNAATGDGVKTDDQSALTGEIDYKAEYAALVDENARLERDRDNYRKIGLNKKGKKADDDDDATVDLGDEDGTVDALAEKVAARLLPRIQQTVASDTIGSVMNELSGDADEQKLIMYHFNNSVASNGTIRERLENAKLIANKKSILKANKELTVALRNRAQIGNTAQGSSTEDGQKQGDTYFTPEQINFFKKRGLDPEKVKANMIARKNKA